MHFFFIDLGKARTISYDLVVSCSTRVSVTNSVTTRPEPANIVCEQECLLNLLQVGRKLFIWLLTDFYGCTVQCPICQASVVELDINRHLDSDCRIGGHSRVNSLAVPSSSKNSSLSKKTDDSKSIAPIFSQKKRPIEPSQISDACHDDDDSTPTQPLNARPPKRQKISTINNNSGTPLAERLRPKEFSEFVGQDHLTGPNSLLVHLLQGSNGSAGSMILWGPSGCGKTTLARLLAKRTDAALKEVSATSSGTTEVRNMIEEAKKLLSLTGR